jgi:hypothetical protein
MSVTSSFSTLKWPSSPMTTPTFSPLRTNPTADKEEGCILPPIFFSFSFQEGPEFTSMDFHKAPFDDNYSLQTMNSYKIHNDKLVLFLLKKVKRDFDPGVDFLNSDELDENRVNNTSTSSCNSEDLYILESRSSLPENIEVYKSLS